ncbi:MAG: FecR domain-containing protein [Ginsengibacter sp.]
MSNNRLFKLADAYLKGESSAEEERELHDWYDSQINDEEEKVIISTNETEEEIGKRILHEIRAKIEAGKKSEKDKVVLFRKPLFWVAASVIFLLAFALVFSAINKPSEEVLPAGQISSEYTNDVQPGRQKAMLVLSDGKKVPLDKSESGKVIMDGSTEVMNEEGSLIYNNVTGEDESVRFNTLITSRGETYPLVLSDGSKVWLNSASSIRFPVVFKGKERAVEITGEAYFEVAHNNKMPFRVSVNNMEVKVLGTHFNINSYNDDGAIKTTLLQGSVRVMEGNKSVLIKPGEQAQVFDPAFNPIKKIQVQTVNVDDVVAWKNGFFSFRHSNLKDIVKQLSRWYDIEVKYEGDIKQQEFTGKIDRHLSLSEVLKIMEQTGVYFKIEGKTLTILR